MSQQATQKPQTVILWVHPRSTSTMFECCMLNKQDEFRVLHEPMGDAFYFGPERVSDRYSPEQCQETYKHYSDSTFEKVWNDMVTTARTGPQRTFSKDMAQYIFNQSSSTHIKSVPSFCTDKDSTNDNTSLIPNSLLLDPSIHHTFLIRHPSKAIPSYEKLCFPGSDTGFEYFDPKEAGYRELRMLFDILKKEGRQPLLIESEELLKDPKGVMGMWCADSGIDFNESMLEWNEGTREHFAKWPGFHVSAEQSKGIGKVAQEHTTKPKANSPQVEECIQACMEDYEYLKGFARKA